ncbi:MAG: VWA domain-containing protein [Phycisphaerales bacterium]|nr:VWA domain-containing protein [Phycisphaerales bacterium]
MSVTLTLAISWIAPLAGTIVALSTIPPLVALYFLRLRRTRRVISTTMLWTRATQDLRANAPFQRLRLSLLLLLQLLALALVVLAIAQPEADLGESKATRVVMLIDHSGSMNALDGIDGMSRLAEAKQRAAARLRSLHGGGMFSGPAPSVMVIAFSKDAQVLCPFTDNVTQAMHAVESVLPTDGTTTLTDAFELARAFTTVTNPDDESVVIARPPAYELFSDGIIANMDRTVLRAGERMTYHSVGQESTESAGIGALAAARNPERTDEVQVFARVVNWGRAPLTSDLEVLVDGRLRAVTPAPIVVPAAGKDAAVDAAMGGAVAGEMQVVFPSLSMLQGGVIEVRLAKNDALIADDRAAVIVAPPHPLKIALVGRGGFVMRSLLEGMALASLELFSIEEWNRRMTIDAQSPDAFDVIVLDNAMPDSIARGRYLIFGAPPTSAGIIPYGTKSSTIVRSIREEHPLLQYVNLDDLFVASMTAVAGGAECEVIVEASEGPLILTMHRGPLTLVYVAFDPMESDWPFQRGFVNFFANALAWLAAGGTAVADEPLAPGDVATARLPAGAHDIAMRDPGGGETPIVVQDAGNLSYGPLARSGVYRLHWSGAKGSSGTNELAFAVNMNARAEGRANAAREIQFATERVAGVQGGAITLSSLWPWLLLGAFVLLCVEWWVWLRRV